LEGKIMTIVISERALFMRIKRKLDRIYGQTLHTCRYDTRAFLEFGRYYAIDPYSGGLVDWYIDLNDMAQELGINATTPQPS